MNTLIVKSLLSLRVCRDIVGYVHGMVPATQKAIKQEALEQTRQNQAIIFPGLAHTPQSPKFLLQTERWQGLRKTIWLLVISSQAPIPCPQQPSHGIRNKPVILNILPFNPPAITKRVCFSTLDFQIKDNSPKLFLESSRPEKEGRWGSREERNSIIAVTEPANTGLDAVFRLIFTSRDQAKSQ